MPGQCDALDPARIVPHSGQGRQVAEAVPVRGRSCTNAAVVGGPPPPCHSASTEMYQDLDRSYCELLLERQAQEELGEEAQEDADEE